MRRVLLTVAVLLACTGARADGMTDAIYGFDAYNAGDFDTAYELFTSAIAQGGMTHEVASQVRAGRGNILTVRGRFDEALADYAVGREELPMFPDNFFGAALVYVLTARGQQALDLTSEVAGTERGWSNTRAVHAWALFLLGRRDEALADLDDAIDYDDGSAFLYIVRAGLRHDLGDDAAATADAAEALALDPGLGGYLRNLAITLANGGHAYMAIQLLDWSLLMEPDVADAWGVGAVLVAGTKGCFRAGPWIDRALELDAANEYGLHARGLCPEG